MIPWHQGCRPVPTDMERYLGEWRFVMGRANVDLIFGTFMRRTERSLNSNGGNSVCLVMYLSLIKSLLLCTVSKLSSSRWLVCGNGRAVACRFSVLWSVGSHVLIFSLMFLVDSVERRRWR